MNQLEMFETTNFFESKFCANRDCDVLITYEQRLQNNKRFRGKGITKDLVQYHKDKDFCCRKCALIEIGYRTYEKHEKNYIANPKFCRTCKKIIPPSRREGKFSPYHTNLKNYCDKVCKWIGIIDKVYFGYDFEERINLIEELRKDNEKFTLIKWINKNRNAAYRRSKRDPLKYRIHDYDLTTKYLYKIFPKDYKCPMLGVDLIIRKHRLANNEEVRHDNLCSLDRHDSDIGYVEGNVVWVSWKANQLKHTVTPKDLNLLYLYFKKQEHNPNLNAQSNA
jgi:hypothetical protein|tara:strand:- start:364 stop:1200 length:837 start_codon:yes stop_codon:yes gene_type:complete